MKTLDEVIKGMEHCHEDNCMECPYQFEPKDFDCITQCQYTDALHYLKEYQKLDSLDAVAFPEDDNPPLDWEQLKDMVGKPVWYEHEFWKGWIILGKVEQGVNCEMIPDREERWYIVKDGSAKAYRKERK